MEISSLIHLGPFNNHKLLSSSGNPDQSRAGGMNPPKALPALHLQRCVLRSGRYRRSQHARQHRTFARGRFKKSMINRYESRSPDFHHSCLMIPGISLRRKLGDQREADPRSNSRLSTPPRREQRPSQYYSRALDPLQRRWDPRFYC